MPDEFPDHDAAVCDCTATTHSQRVARLTGELHELLALTSKSTNTPLSGSWRSWTPRTWAMAVECNGAAGAEGARQTCGMRMARALKVV